MDYSSNINRTNQPAIGGHVLHKADDPIVPQPVSSSSYPSSDINAFPGGHQLHRSEDPIVPSSNLTSMPSSDINAFSSSSTSMPSNDTFSSSLSSGAHGQLLNKGEDVVRTADFIQQDVQQAGLTRAEPAVRETQDAAQNLMWELEREKQRQYEERELERERQLRQVPTDQAIQKADAIIEKTDEIKKDAKAQGYDDINPAIKDTRDAAKNLKKELQHERKELEPEREGFLDRAKGWFSGDKDRSDDNLSAYEAERRLHTDSDLKHHDAMVKEINKRDRVGEEKEGFMDRAKGWFSKDKEHDTKPVVPEYQEARMQHPDLVVKYHDDVVDDINKRDKVGEEGLIQKVKNLFKGSHEPSSEDDKSKPVLSSSTGPVHDFQDHPTSSGILPATNATSFPQNTQTVFLPEQRGSLPTAADTDKYNNFNTPQLNSADSSQFSTMSNASMTAPNMSDVSSYPSSDPMMQSSNINAGSQFNPSTSSLSSSGATIDPVPLRAHIDSGLPGSHAQLYHPSSSRQADV